MKFLFSFLASYLLGFGLTLTGCASNVNLHEGIIAGAQSMDSVDYHLSLIQNHEARATMLEEKIQRVEERIKSHNRKPSRDRRGVKRKAWKRFIREWQQEVKEIRVRVAWHNKEIERLQPLTQEPVSLNEAEDQNS